MDLKDRKFGWFEFLASDSSVYTWRFRECAVTWCSMNKLLFKLYGKILFQKLSRKRPLL